MMRKLPTFLVVLVVCLLASCKPALPGDIISPGKMEDILYDYHLALAMLQHDNKGSENLVWQETLYWKNMMFPRPNLRNQWNTTCAMPT